MSVDINRLRELEQMADSAPWIQDGTVAYDCYENEWITHCNYKEQTKFICEMRNALPALHDELEQLRAQVENDRWRDCKTELPTETKKYRVWNSHINKEETETWYDEWAQWMWPDCAITHWRPMPLPPQEGTK